jgi:serine/threonine-protein kinase
LGLRILVSEGHDRASADSPSNPPKSDGGKPSADAAAVVGFASLGGDSDDAPTLPNVIGERYRVGRELGHGGMARVYLAHDIKHGRDVAVKVIRAELAASFGRERFLREIAIAARLRHPNIVRMYDSGDADGALYFVMPYEDGPSLRTRLATGGPLSIPDVINVLRDVARAVQYAHAQGVVHRDIKPDNVMMSGGAAVVADFGIAKAVSAAQSETSTNITGTGAGIGTPAYMAPEQAVGDPSSDHRADIYSFGCVAYELLTGTPPFHGMQTFQIVAAHVSVVPPSVTELRPETPPALAALVAQCLEKSPAARPQQASELVDALEGAVTGPHTAPIARAIAPTARGWTRGRIWLVGILAAAVVVAVGVYVRHRAAEPEPISMAVLPIANISGDTAIAVFADGLSDEVFTALGRVPGLQMRSRSGARNYRGSVNEKEVGRALNVQYIVTGTMRHMSGRLIISTQLTNTADGSELWSDTFDRNPEQQLGVADEIANGAARALRERFPRVLGVAAPRAPNQQTTNPEAHRLFVLGQELLLSRRSVKQSGETFRQAVALDSSYAGAYGGLAMALALAPYFQGVPSADVYAEVTRSAARALQLDPTLSQPHVALGLAYEHAYQWQRAEAEFRTAIGLASDDVEAHVQLGRNLLFRGMLAQGLDQFRLARQRDPASAVVLSWTSYAFFLRGQFDSARVINRQAMQGDSTNATTLALGSLSLFGMGDRDSAISRANRQPPNMVAMYVFAATGDTARAWASLRAVELAGVPKTVVHTGRAFLLLGTRDTSQALAEFKAATDAKEIWPVFEPLSDPMFDDIRGSARLLALMKRVGLPPSAAIAVPGRHRR